MALVEDDDVIQAFSADRTDETLSVRVLPGRSRRSDDLRDPHRSNAMTKCRTIAFVSVPQQILRIWGAEVRILPGAPRSDSDSRTVAAALDRSKASLAWR